MHSTITGVGTLLPVFSLAGRESIGTFGNSAKRWIDWLAHTHQQFWQILPLEYPGYGNSPYQCLSWAAKNPLFIDLEDCMVRGWGVVPNAPASTTVDYSVLWAKKMQQLRTVWLFAQKDPKVLQALELFKMDHAWVNPWATFITRKEANQQRPWWEWTQVLTPVDPFHIFIQWIAHEQWQGILRYAESKHIRIIGDLPFYMGKDSDSVWVDPAAFNVSPTGVATWVAGVPPDYFSQTGQLWGNPIYNWDRMRASNYTWWTQRLAWALQNYHIIRLDHFRAFADYWQIPGDALDAIHGTWLEGEGLAVFKALSPQWQSLPIIIEDLGERTPALKKLLTQTPYPNMGVFEFGFDAKEGSPFRPEQMLKNSVYYTGTHDNAPLMDWVATATPEELTTLQQALGETEITHKSLIDYAMTAKSSIKIIPFWDRIGARYPRINTPGIISPQHWAARWSETLWHSAYVP